MKSLTRLFDRARSDPLIRVAYRSRLVGPPLTIEQLAALIGQADGNNRKVNVTGALACVGDRFFQVLEGSAGNIEPLLRRIEEDPRHTEFTIVMRRPINGRLFDGWAMVAAKVTPSNAESLSKAIAVSDTAPATAVAMLHDLVTRQRGG